MKLTELKNIDGRTAQWLKDIGIDSVERLVVPGRLKQISVNMPRFLPRKWISGMVKRAQAKK